jgi:hypothetical protein
MLSFQDLDLRCEQLIKEEFGVECNFDVVDAVKKLEKLGIVSRVSSFCKFKIINKKDQNEWGYSMYLLCLI